MVPIRDITPRDLERLEAGDVVHQPELGFAIVEQVLPATGAVTLRWERAEVDLPDRVSFTDLAQGYRLCAPGGFFARGSSDHQGLHRTVVSDPVGAMRLLAQEAGAPLSRDDVRRWTLGRARMAPHEFVPWWNRLRTLLSSAAAPGDPLRWQGDRLTWTEPEPGQGTDEMRFLSGSPLDRLRAWLAADEPARSRLSEAALAGDDPAAALLPLRDGCALDDAQARELARQAVAGAGDVCLIAVLLARREPATAERLAAVAADVAWHDLLRRSAGAVPRARRAEVALDLIEAVLALRPDDQFATRLLVESLPESVPEVLARMDAHDGVGDEPTWPLALAWLRRRDGVTGTGLPAADLPLDQLRPLPPQEIFPLSIALARALAVRHAQGDAGGLGGAVRRADGSVELGPVAEGRATDDVHDAMRIVTELAIARLPEGPRVGAELLLVHLGALVPDVPLEWVAVSTLAMAPNREDRPVDALELWARLEQAAAISRVRANAPRRPDVRLDVGHDTHIGKLKSRIGQVNQDAVYWQTDGPLALLVVADGISVSTAGSGNLASAILVQVVAEIWEQRNEELRTADEPAIRAFLDEVLATANRAICEGSLRLADGDLSRHIPMGTTALVAVARGDRVHLAALGDSRVFVIGAAGASQVTADQNLRGEWLRSWQEGRRTELYSEGHALVGYCGHFDESGRPEPVPPLHRSFTLLPTETLLMCSDGLTDYAAESLAAIVRLLIEAAQNDDLDTACRHLVERANAGGGGDNITVLMARLVE